MCIISDDNVAIASCFLHLEGLRGLFRRLTSSRCIEFLKSDEDKE